jgi:MFS family permease
MSTSENLRTPVHAVSETSPPRRVRGQAATLVLVGTLTIMAGATVAPAIPGIRASFAGTANVELLSRLIITTHALAIVLFSPFAGVITDRIGRKPALVAGLLAFGIGGSSGAYLPDLAGIFAGRVVLGIGVSLIMTSSVAMIADLYEGAARQRLLGRQVAATAFGGVVFLLGGGALADLDWRVVFLVYLLGSVLVVPAMLFLPRGRATVEPSTEDAAKPSLGPPVAILAPLAATLLGQVAFYAVPVQVPFLVEEHFGASAFASGAVIAAMTFTMGMVALRFASIRRLAGKHILVSLSFLAIALGSLVMFAANSLVVLTIGLLIMAVGLGALVPNLNNWVVTAAPPHLRGRYAGLLTTSMFLGQFVSPIVTQPIVDADGIQVTFAVIAAALVPISAAYFVAGRRAPADVAR